MEASAPHAIFVYGTLMPGHVAYELVARWVRAARPATARGRLYHLPAGYPAFVADPEGAAVHGQVLSLAPDMPWGPLDAYEDHDPADPAGSLYRREVLGVDGAGEVTHAWVYFLGLDREADLRAEGAIWLPEGRWTA